MPYKSIETRRLKQKIQKRQIRDRSTGDVIEKTIIRFIDGSKSADKLSNRFDNNNFIDKDFCKLLIEECYNKCCYCKCELEYIEYCPKLISIERINNAIGHIKSNVKISCLSCNCSKVGTKNLIISPFSPDVTSVVSRKDDVNIVPEHNPFIYDIMRFELLFDTIRMQELLLRKTRFNVWMNYHLSVLEELQIYFNKTN